MALHLENDDVENFKKRIGYKGCKNCEFQISPLRMCEWAEKRRGWKASCDMPEVEGKI